MSRPLQIIRAALLAMLGLYALFGICVAFVHVFYRLPLGYGENTTFVSAWGLLNGHGLYRKAEISTIPAFLSLYPPIYYLIVAAGMKIWGMTYIPGRLLALLSGLGCAGLIWAISRRRFGSDIPGSLIGALAFLCSWPVMLWLRYLRVDFTAVLFELIAAYILLVGITKRRAAFFLIFSILAGYTKQTAFGIVIGTLAGMFIEGDSGQRKKVIIVSLIYTGVALIIFALIQVITKGGFYTNVVGYNLPLTGITEVFDRMKQLLADPLGFCLILLGFSVVFSKITPFTSKMLVIVPLVITIPALTRIGANVNYYIELLAVSGIAASRLFSVGDEADNRKKFVVACCALLILCLAGSVYSKHGVLRKWYYQLRYYEIALVKPDIIEALKRTQKPGSLVYSQYSEMPLFADCVSAVSDTWHYANMARAGKMDDSPLVEAFKNQRITLIIMKEKIAVSPPMEYMSENAARAALDNYSLITPRPDGFYIYLPKPKTGAP